MKLVNYVNRDEVQKLRATKRVKEIKLVNFSSIVHSKKLTSYLIFLEFNFLNLRIFEKIELINLTFK